MINCTAVIWPFLGRLSVNLTIGETWHWCRSPKVVSCELSKLICSRYLGVLKKNLWMCTSVDVLHFITFRVYLALTLLVVSDLNWINSGKLGWLNQNECLYYYADCEHHNRSQYGSCHLSVCLSFPFRLLTRRLKLMEKPQFMCTFPRAKVTTVSIFG